LADRLRSLLAGRPIKKVRGRIVLAVDVTAWLRPDANCSPGRLYCHVTGHGRDQDQMVPGWTYSFVAAVEPGPTSWTPPPELSPPTCACPGKPRPNRVGSPPPASAGLSRTSTPTCPRLTRVPKPSTPGPAALQDNEIIGERRYECQAKPPNAKKPSLNDSKPGP
jgi:hypothetical protein